ncbi:MAG: FkbM family methyltransferase [Acidimicrobiales bacterium]
MVAYIPDDQVWNLSRELILSRIYEIGGIRLERCSGNVIDAGAHVGIFTLMASKHARRVLSIEASPTNIHILRLNVRQNGAENVDVVEGALWSTDGDTYFAAGDDSGSGSIHASGQLHRCSYSLDSLIDRIGGSVDVLKIDVEGAEHEALLASKQIGQINAIVGELHYPIDSVEVREIENYLVDNGFDVQMISEEYYYGSEMRRRAENNFSSLKGNRWMKVLMRLYFRAPRFVHKRTPGSTELPGIVAVKRSAVA